MIKRFCLLFLTVFLAVSVRAQDKLSGGGDLNPDLKVPYAAQQDFLDLRVGLSVHWGPSSLGGKEISWSRGGIIPREEYDAFYKDFNPVDFDAKEWCKLMKRWGIKYIAPTAKHHDGFALWFSDYSEYDMENAARKVDIMEELRKACKKHGIVLGAYYSNLDWFHPDWFPYNYGGPGFMFQRYGDTPKMERYLEYMRNQVTELIEKYDVKFMQFDGEWDSTYTHEIGSQMYRDLHEVNPNILLSSRIDIGRRSEGANNHLYMDGQKFAGDFMDRERLVNHGNNVTEWFDDAWQAWVTIDKTQWSFNPNPQLMRAQDIIEDMIGVIGNNGNYMINVAPTPSGSFVPEQIALMDTLGMWIKSHDEAIYGTRGGPYYPYSEGVSTRKGEKAWLMITDKDVIALKLPTLSQKIKSATIFGSKTKIEFNDSGEVTVFTLPKAKKDEIRVVELTFNEEVVMGKRRDMPNSFELGGSKRLTEGIHVTTSSKYKDIEISDENTQKLVSGMGSLKQEYAFHTDLENNPYVLLDLGSKKDVTGLIIHNRRGGYHERAKDLCVWVSNDGKEWVRQWKAGKIADKWAVSFSRSYMGADVPGVEARYVKIGLDSTEANYLHLARVEVYTK